MLVLLASALFGPNLIANPNFNQDRKGFTTHYAYSRDLFYEGTFVVGDDPKKFHSGGFSMGDHTTGKGMMLIINGGAFERDSVWQGTVKVEAGQRYEFSGWTASWSMNPNDGTASDLNPGRLQIWIDGEPVGPVHKVEAKSGVWNQFTIPWKSGSKKQVEIKIVNTNVSNLGNDFALDDLFFGIAKEK